MPSPKTASSGSVSFDASIQSTQGVFSRPHHYPSTLRDSPPTLKRATLRMSPASQISKSGRSESPHKRAVSFAGFFQKVGKILPSNRAEQGGTLRPESDPSGESAYRDLGINPEELTQWNIAEDIPPKRRAQLTLSNSAQGHHRASSLSPRKLRGKYEHPQPEKQPSPIRQAAQTRSLLESKEKVRQQRRELKASGDWLGVTGADPWTGEFNVLTPTDTLSSVNSLETQEKMGKLSQSVRDAKLAYQRAKSQVEAEKARLKMEKDQAKLDKIERTKEDLKRGLTSVRWSQHKGHWSSATGPNLSTIASSLNSDTPLENTTPQRQHDRNRSTDTIIRTPSRHLSPHVSFAFGTDSPIGDSIEHTPDSDPGPRPSAKHFLGGRRRMTDPGGLFRNEVTAISSSMTDSDLRAISLNITQKPDHFPNLMIPDYHLDYHLGLTNPNPVPECAMMTSSEESTYPLSTESSPNTSMNSSPILCPILSQKTKSLKENTIHNLNKDAIVAVTATLSQSRLKELMRRPSIPRKLALNLSDTDQVKENNLLARASRHSLNPFRHHRRTRSGQGQGQAESESRTAARVVASEPTRLPWETQSQRSPEWAGQVIQDMNKSIETVRRESVCIPIITTTGSDRAPPSQPELQLHMDQFDGPADSISVTQVSPEPNQSSKSCSQLISESKISMTASPPTKPLNDSPNLVLHLKTPNTGIASTLPATSISSTKSVKTRASTPVMRTTLRMGHRRTGSADTEHTIKTHTSPSPSRSAHQRQRSDSEQREAMIVEAGRIAFRKHPSPAKVVNHKDRNLRKINADQKEKNKPWEKALVAKEAGSADTVALSKIQRAPQAEADAVKTACFWFMLVASLVWAAGHSWYTAVKPAFERQSPLWKRRCDEKSTWKDVGVFLSAGCFCIVASVLSWYGLNAVCWVLG